MPTATAASRPVPMASASCHGWRRTIWRTASAAGSTSSAIGASGCAMASSGPGSRRLAPTMSCSVPVVAARAASPMPATSTSWIPSAMQRSRSTGRRTRRLSSS